MTNNMRVHGGGALALAVALLAGCAAADKAPPPVAVLQGPGQAALTVSEENSGARIVLEPGQALRVRLALVVSTGLEWSLVEPKPGVLVEAGSRFERAQPNVSTEAAAGAQVWQFKPQAAGSVALRFELRRPRNVAPAVQTVSYDVTVK